MTPPGVLVSRPDLPRSAADRPRAGTPIPARTPALVPLRYEAEIARRDPHSLAVCGQIRDANPPQGQCVTSIPKSCWTYFPGFRPSAAPLAPTVADAVIVDRYRGIRGVIVHDDATRHQGRRVRQGDRPHHPLEPHVPRAFTSARGGNVMKPGSSANALEVPWRPLG